MCVFSIVVKGEREGDPLDFVIKWIQITRTCLNQELLYVTMVPLINIMHRQIYNAHVLLGQFYLIYTMQTGWTAELTRKGTFTGNRITVNKMPLNPPNSFRGPKIE